MAATDPRTIASQMKRASNRENSASILRTRGIKFTSNNDGAHLIVKHHGHVVDFWPGTGKYIFRPGGKANRGVFNLMRDLGKA